MPGIITTGNIPKALQEGLFRIWGREYGKHPKFHTEMFEVKGSKKKYEEDVEVTGFGLAPVKDEADGISYDSESQGTVKRYTHVVYGLGFICTWEEQEDGQYPEVTSNRTTALAFSMETTRQTVCAGVFNNGFDSNFPGGDAKEWFATDHPTVNGTQSNELSPSADFSITALQDLIIQIRKATNSRGLEIALMPTDLAGPPELEFEFDIALNSVNQPNTADNDINAVRNRGYLRKSPIINPHLDDPDAWFVRTNCPKGATFVNRKETMFDRDNDFDTKNLKYAAVMRFDAGWTDFRGYFASAGA
jgi:hypothetical protein